MNLRDCLLWGPLTWVFLLLVATACEPNRPGEIVQPVPLVEVESSVDDIVQAERVK